VTQIMKLLDLDAEPRRANLEGAPAIGDLTIKAAIGATQ